jgi:hypothetical protein
MWQSLAVSGVVTVAMAWTVWTYILPPSARASLRRKLRRTAATGGGGCGGCCGCDGGRGDC